MGLENEPTPVGRARGEGDPLGRPGRFASRAAYTVDVEVALGWPVLRALSDAETVLDVGCGSQVWSWTRRLGPQRLRRSLGLDAFKSSFDPCPSGTRYGAYVQGDGAHLPFRDGSFDAVIALDFIEHLPKDSGGRAVAEMKRVAQRTVVVMTPNGFVPQESAENPFQRHLSGWSLPELEALGFKVFGIRGLRNLRGGFARPKIRPYPVGLGLSLLTAPLARVRPTWAFQLVGVWRRVGTAESERDRPPLAPEVPCVGETGSR